MILQGFKEIAAYLSSKIGPKSERTCRRYTDLDVDPLPVRGDIGPVVAETAEIDSWVLRRWKLRSKAALP